VPNLFWEIVQAARFFGSKNRRWRNILFYSESSFYFQYFEGLIRRLTEEYRLDVGYLTSDENDPLLKRDRNRMKVFHFKKLLPFVLHLADAKVIVMTMTDLHRFHIRRSRRGANHVYLFHAMVSTHMTYRRGAFDHYDTVFCVGPHHKEEIRRWEELCGLPPKTLIEDGYPWLEKIHAAHREFRAGRQTGEAPLILIAPSWNEANILEYCGEELIGVLAEAGYRVTVRPHPETVRRKPALIAELRRKFADRETVSFETDFLSDQSLHEAALLITDWSGIALEYAFGTERPVLFVDTPRKINNPDYQKLGIEPLEVKIRGELGPVVSPPDIRAAAALSADLIKNGAPYRDKIRDLRNRWLYDFGKSSEQGARYIASLCGPNERE
jgi:YidC/Oxa1 family membrane protein insertase